MSVLNLGERLLTLDRIFQIVFCPLLADFKYEAVRGYPDGFIDVCLFNGAIRTSEQAEDAADVEITPDSQMAAMIAYLQRLGKAKRPVPEETVAAGVEQ